MFERMKDWWENLGLRERRLMALAAVAIVLTGTIWTVLFVRDRLAELETHNESIRQALATLDEKRDALSDEKGQQGDVLAQIGEEPPPPLGTYLEKAGTEVGVQIRQQAEKPMAVKNKFNEYANQIVLFDVTLDQVAQYLKKIESQPTVITQHVIIKRSSINKEKMDRVEITAATYARPKKGKGGGEARTETDAGK